MTDAAISGCAFRLDAVLLRYGQSYGQRMPGRTLLAAPLCKASTDTVDRALKGQTAVGAVAVIDPLSRHGGRGHPPLYLPVQGGQVR